MLDYCCQKGDSFQMQVIARSLEIWGDEEAMEEERERRMNARDKKKQKQFDKKVKGEQIYNSISHNLEDSDHLILTG